MAAKYPGDTVSHVSLKKLERALEQLAEKVAEEKQQLTTTFQQLHQMLEERQETLAGELDAITADIATKIAERRESVEQLTQHKEETERKLQANRLNEFLQQQLSGIRTEINRILSEKILFPHVSVTCDLEFIQIALEDRCHISKRDNPYATRTLPVWHGVARGEGVADLYTPTSISIDPTSQSIYVGDGSYHRIQVFTSEGQYLSTLHNQQLTQIYAMKMNGDHIFLSTNYSIFKLNKRGEIVKELNPDTTIFGMFIEGVKLYTCAENSLTVQVYDLNLKPTKKVLLEASSFEDNTTPRDVILNRQHLFVLFSYNSLTDNYHPQPIQIFQLDGTFIRSLVTGKRIKNARYFCLDSFENILVSDYHGHCVRVLSPDGILLQSVGSDGTTGEGGLLNPRGVAVDSQCRIVIVDSKVSNRLQAF